jgi:hypothetical protein
MYTVHQRGRAPETFADVLDAMAAMKRAGRGAQVRDAAGALLATNVTRDHGRAPARELGWGARDPRKAAAS